MTVGDDKSSLHVAGYLGIITRNRILCDSVSYLVAIIIVLWKIIKAEIPVT